jgi:hypothetical protein
MGRQSGRSGFRVGLFSLNERLLRPCVCCAKMFATNLPQQQNGCLCWQP